MLRLSELIRTNKYQTIKRLVKSESYKEEKDINKLLSMSKSKVTKIKMISNNNVEIMVEAKVSTIEQVIEKRTYSDGSTEKVSVINSIVTPAYTDVYNTSDGYQDMSFALRAYVTYSLTEDGQVQRGCERIQTVYTKYSSAPVYVTKDVLTYQGGCYDDDVIFSKTFNSPASGTTYTWYPGDKPHLKEYALFVMMAQADYYFSNGYKLRMLLDLHLNDKTQ